MHSSLKTSEKKNICWVPSQNCWACSDSSLICLPISDSLLGLFFFQKYHEKITELLQLKQNLKKFCLLRNKQSISHTQTLLEEYWCNNSFSFTFNSHQQIFHVFHKTLNIKSKEEFSKLMDGFAVWINNYHNNFGSKYLQNITNSVNLLK